MKTHSKRNRSSRYRALVMLASAMLFGACAAYGPYHPNTATEPLNSVRGPADGRYKMAFIEFGDQGSALDESQRAAALSIIRKGNAHFFSSTFTVGKMMPHRAIPVSSNTFSTRCRAFPRCAN